MSLSIPLFGSDLLIILLISFFSCNFFLCSAFVPVQKKAANPYRILIDMTAKIRMCTKCNKPSVARTVNDAEVFVPKNYLTFNLFSSAISIWSNSYQNIRVVSYCLQNQFSSSFSSAAAACVSSLHFTANESTTPNRFG